MVVLTAPPMVALRTLYITFNQSQVSVFRLTNSGQPRRIYVLFRSFALAKLRVLPVPLVLDLAQRKEWQAVEAVLLQWRAFEQFFLGRQVVLKSYSGDTVF